MGSPYSVMLPTPSRILVGTLESCPDAPGRFFAFGERDDPMRLTVLMAKHVARLLPREREIQDKTQICLDPRAPWRMRRGALEDVLARASEQWKGHFIALVDIDALAPQGEERWTDDRALSMRKDLFTLVGHAIERGGWLVLRTCPSRSASPELGRLAVEITHAADLEGSPHEVTLFAPEVRPVAMWLLERAGFKPRDLSRIVEQVTEFDAHLLDLAYQALTAVARDTGKLLASLRPPQHYDGVMGPFAYADQHPSATTLPRDAVEELRGAGVLQPGLEPSTLRMPRLARELLSGFASIGMTGEVRKLHERLGAIPIEAKPAAEQIEIHHHAVRAGDVVLAKSTALFYGTELRDLATQLSLDARREPDRHEKTAKFRMAAELFAHVVRHFDMTDGYAWEYLGYNLARTRDPSQKQSILDAYERAHELWPANPLYHGRLLGFRGQLGLDVADEVMLWLDRYVEQYGDGHDAVSYFAEAALKGLRRGKQQQQLEKISSRKRSILERFAPRAIAAVEDDE